MTVIDRRSILHLGAGSVVATLASPAFAAKFEPQGGAGRLVVFNDDNAEGRDFARAALKEGGVAFAVTGSVAPRRRQEFLRQLTTTPAVIVALTTDDNAFQLAMAANDAFHHLVVRETIRDGRTDAERLIAWAMAPVRERSRHRAGERPAIW